MRILLTNDDGVYADGLKAIAVELKKINGRGYTIISAPRDQHSAVSSSITLYNPLIVEKFELEQGITTYVLANGTPADSVKLALKELLPNPPDIVVSGINFGLNSGSNILYSGTVAAALEASQFGHTSVAVSLELSRKPDFTGAAGIAGEVIQFINKKFKKSGITFNVNIPAKTREIKGIKITRQENNPYIDSFQKRIDPRGRTYYWIKGSPEVDYNPTSRDGFGPFPTDAWAIDNGYVSITPLKRDLTHISSLHLLGKLAKIKL